MAKQTVIGYKEFDGMVKITSIKNVLTEEQIEKEIGEENAKVYLSKKFSFVRELNAIKIKTYHGEIIYIGIGKIMEVTAFKTLLKVMFKAGQRFDQFKKLVNKKVKI